MGIIDKLCCLLEDLIVKLSVINFKLNQKYKEIEKRNKDK